MLGIEVALEHCDRRCIGYFRGEQGLVSACVGSTSHQHRIALGGACVALLAVAGAVLQECRAQEIEQYLPITVPGYDQRGGAVIATRPLTEYDPLGVHVGAFTVRTQLNEGVLYNDNVLGRSGGPGSWAIGTAPSVSFNSNFARNSIGGSFSLNDTHYLDQPAQTRTDYSASLGGTYQIGSDSVTIAASELYQHEDPTSIDSRTLQTPLGFHVTDVRVLYDTSFGRWRLEPTAEYLAFRFDDQTLPGDTFRQKVRDRDAYVGALTTRYEFFPGRSVVFVVRGVQTRYVASLGGAIRPDSTAYEALAGIDYSVSGNLQVLLLGGYEVRQFQNSALHTISSPVAQAAVIWTPTGLTTVTAKAARTIQDAIGETTTGVTTTQGRLVVDHELRRNWLLQAAAGAVYAEYAQGGGNQTVYSAGTSATYRVNRNLRVTGSYNFTAITGTTTQLGFVPFGAFAVPNSNFNQNLFLLQVGLAL